MEKKASLTNLYITFILFVILTTLATILIIDDGHCTTRQDNEAVYDVCFNQVKTGWSKYTFFLKYTNAKPKGMLDSVYTVELKDKKMRVVFKNDTVHTFSYMKK